MVKRKKRVVDKHRWAAMPHPETFLDLPLTSSGLLVYLTLIGYANTETGLCYPSLSTIAEVTKLSRRFVIETIKTLEKQGLLTVTKKSTLGSAYKIGWVHKNLHAKKNGKRESKSALEAIDRRLEKARSLVK